MFSRNEKQFIATKIEEIILGLDHPEMPKEKPAFKSHINGKESWSWADIRNNGAVETPSVNPFNEMMAAGRTAGGE